MDKVKGVGLIEVLVSLVILTVGLLGAARMQVLSLQEGVQSHFSSQAQIAVDDLMGRMMSNRTSAQAGQYAMSALASKSESNCDIVVCTSDQMAKHDLWQVSETINVLPEAAMAITFNQDLLEYQVGITWNAQSGQSDKLGSIDSYTAPNCNSIDDRFAGCLFIVVRI